MVENGNVPIGASNETATVTVQFDTPDVSSVTNTETSVRAISGVKSIDTSSLALGGISVMKVVFDGDIAGLRAALIARGFRVDEGAGTLRIRRAASPAGVPKAATTPTP